MNHEDAITWKVATQVWWSIIWRFFAFFLAIGFALGVIMKLIQLSGGTTEQFSNNALAASALYVIVLWIVMVIVSIFAVKKALAVKWTEFRIVIQPRDLLLEWVRLLGANA